MDGGEKGARDCRLKQENEENDVRFEASAGGDNADTFANVP